MYKILIADDEELELKSMKIFLGRNYPEIELLPDARDGTKVIELALEHQPDIIILDIEMPGLNGLKALEMLRKQGYKSHVIVKTAYSRFTYAQEALHLQADAYLLKPVKKEELKKELDCILQKVKEEKQAEANQRKGFAGGFIVSMAFPSGLLETVEFEGFCNEIPKRLSLLCDFSICPLERNILPILAYSENSVSESVYQQLKDDIGRILAEAAKTVLGLEPEIKFGCLIEDIHKQLPRTYFSLLEKTEDKKAEEAKTGVHLTKVLDYINKHYSEDISLEDAAAHVKINSSYLSHLFKQEFHRNFVEYLTEVRMKRAIGLIDEGIENASVLAEKVGYQYTSYFCKQFKKYTGYTVSEYKRRRK